MLLGKSSGVDDDDNGGCAAVLYSARNLSGATPLHYCCFSSDNGDDSCRLECARLLLTAGAHVDGADCTDGSAGTDTS